MRDTGDVADHYGGRYLHEDELRDLGMAEVGSNVRVHSATELVGLSRIHIGSNVRIDAFSILLANDPGSIRIGDYVHIGAYCYLAGRGGISVGDFAGISQGARIYSTNDDYSGRGLTGPLVPERYRLVDSRPVEIGRHAIVGSGTIVLPGATLAEGVAVGALSLVSRSLDPWTIYAGRPARRIRARHRDLDRHEADLRGDSGRP